MYVNGIMFLESEECQKAQEMSYVGAVCMLCIKGLTKVRSSLRRGYIRKGKGYTNCLVVPYQGNYGVGYSVHIECNSTRYHVVDYWVEEV